MSDMTFLKLDETRGGPVLVNMAKVERITKETGGKAKLWFSADDQDTLIAEQAYEYVLAELFHSGNMSDSPGVARGY